jgi:hypothetical protein
MNKGKCESKIVANNDNNGKGKKTYKKNEKISKNNETI